ncbi:MAG TPA: DNA primase [Acidiferrobacterales bacterium]|nr:DNA primase [Acidiferrobacterales bacterium]
MPGKIPKKFIDDLLSRIDIIDVIDARVPLKKAGKDYKACCPFHEEKTPSFTVSQDKQFYHCFGCGVNGSAIKFLMDYEHMSFPEAVKDLAQRAGVTVPHDTQYSEDKPDITAPLLDVLGQADRFYRRMLREHPQAHEAIDYLKRRGLTGEIAADFGLGFAPDGWDNLLKAVGTTEESRTALLAAGLLVKKDAGGYYDRFRHRVMFPIHDHRGRLIGFGGRVLDQGEPKYLNSPETPLFHKGRELYGLYRARDALKRTGWALVVEGYMDVVALAQYGLDYAVATLGTATTRDHLERLFRYVPEVVFCFDGDRAGREAAWRALENGLPVLHEGRQVSFLFLPEGEDPDTLVRKEGAAEFGARLKSATPLPDYFFQHLAAQVDLNRLDGRARLVELARPHLSKMRPGVLRQLMVARLAELSHLPVAELGRLLDGGERPVTLMAQRDSRRPAGGQARPSLVRTAIALLLQHPELARTVVDAGGEFRALAGRPGVELLFDLLQLLRDRPDIKTGFIIEHYRDSEYQRALEKLLAWEHPALSGDIEAEFQGVLDQLRREALGAETERLMDKDRLSGLTTAEKIELKRLLAQKSGGQPV